MLPVLLLACAELPAPADVGGVPGGALEVGLAGAWTEGDRAVSLPWPQQVGPFAATRIVALPEDWDPATRVVFHAEATGWRVRAFVDGAEVGTDVGGVRPVEIDLTGKLHGGDNTLRLVLSGPAEHEVVAGRSVANLAAFTGDQPRRGRVLVAGAPWLEIEAPVHVDAVSAALREGQLVARAETTGAVGERVAFTVVKDGDVIARLPDAVVGADGVAEARAGWSGPRWTPEDPALAWIVATLPDGAARQARFGPRELVLEGRRMRRDGEPVYLAVQRWGRGDAAVRADVATFAASLARRGANGIELHAANLVSEVLDAADELGLYAVVTPICDGRRRTGGGVRPYDAWLAQVGEGHRRIVRRLGGHPSLALWNIETAPERGDEVIHAPFAPSGVPTVDMLDSIGVLEDQATGDPRGDTTWLNELPWRDVATAGPRLDALLERHRAIGSGVALPDFVFPGGRASAAPELAWEETLRPILAAHDIPPWPGGDRRGPAEVEVQVRRGDAVVEGAIVVLRAPGQAPVAAASDARGLARLSLDHAGLVTVEVWGGAPTPVTLVPGAYTGGGWSPRVATVALAVP